MNCDRCGVAVDGEEMRDYAGQWLCEDCYMDALSPTRTCDPWAVHLAKGSMEREGINLTSRQEQLYELVRQAGEVAFPEAARRLELSETELRREFAVLRHMELLRAAKVADQVVITLF